MKNDKDLPFKFFKKNSNPEFPEKLFFKPYSELTDKEKEDLEKLKLTPSPTPGSSLRASFERIPSPDPLNYSINLPESEVATKCCKCRIS